MCRQAWCLRAVLEQTLGLLSCFGADDPTEHALITALARGFDASLAGHVVLEPGSGSATISVWPPRDELCNPREVLGRLPEALPWFLQWLETQRSSTSRPVAVSQSPWQTTVASAGPTTEVSDVVDVVHVPLSHEGAALRAVVLVRPTAFDRRDLHVLDRLREPISVLVRLAAHGAAEAATASPRTDADRLAGLTAREVDVLRLVAEGLLATTIAARLDVSPRTVHKHLGSVYRKLDAHDRLLAVRRAETLGLLAHRHPENGHDDEVVLTMRW